MTFDELESGLVDVLSGSVSVDEYLKDASAAEIQAQADKKAEELENKDKE